MTVMGIRADFPQGVYRGHTAGDRHDLLPSPLRLHAALVAAAGNGSTAVENHGALERGPAAERALRWLEDNPPEYVALPECQTAVADDRPFAYMDEGVVENVKTSPARRKAKRFVVDSTALAGPIGWGWDEIPLEVASSLDELCADVPCLGETDSPVVLELADFEPTHRRSTSSSPFAPVAIRLAVASRGRLAELDDLYAKAQPVKPPTVSADKWTATEQPSPSRITHDHSVSLGYDRIDDSAGAPAAAPWDHVIHIAVAESVPVDEQVQWAVALHRALVAALGPEANSAITGRYEPGVERPANRLAIQYLDDAQMALSNHSGLGPGFALLVSDDSLEDVMPVLGIVKRLYRGGAGEIRLGARSFVSATEFWKRPVSGTRRFWCARAVVPETRRQKPTGARRWTMADAARLSLGFVYRERLGDSPTGSAGARYRTIADRVEVAGVEVVQATPIPDSDVAKYAHKVPQGVVVAPYKLMVTPGSLIAETGLVAVGQSRHLGGGLLVPMDVEPAVADILGSRP